MSTLPPIAAPSSSDAPIWRVFLSAFHAQALVMADDLGLFAALARAPLTTGELAASLAIEPRAVEAIGGVLAALELVAIADGAFHLTDVARDYLVPGRPYYWGGMLRRIRENPLDARKLVGALRRDRAAAEARVTELWHAPTPPVAALEAFTHAMHAHSFALAMRIIPHLDLPADGHFLDVAGGSGSYSIAAALRHPTLRCTLLDLPPVCAIAGRYAHELGVGDRIELHAADMFREAWPSGVDRVFMSDIFHDWDDVRCTALAARAHAALRSGGQLVIHEMLVGDAKDGPLPALAYSMAMLFSTEGQQRTGGELRAILAAAGFANIRIAMTSGGYAAIMGEKR